MDLNVFVVIMILGGYFSAKIFTKIKLPSILGIVIFGIFTGTFFKDKIPTSIMELEPFLKSFALIVILLRAGLDLRKDTLKRVGLPAILMALVPCFLEGSVLTLSFHQFFKFPWMTAGLTGFMLAAVSPAVVVPTMLKFKKEGYGKEKDVTTIVLAGASVDDVLAITLFSLFLGLHTSSELSIFSTLIEIPKSLTLGIILGVIGGYGLIFYFKKFSNNIRATEKSLVLLMTSMILVKIGDVTHSAALLGVMTVGFIILEKNEKVAHELANKMGKIWIFAEIILFFLIGLSVDIRIAFDSGIKGLLVITCGLIFRSIGVIIATHFSNLNKKERLFCVISYLPKATVQAALGAVALNMGIEGGEVILAIAVLAIVFTAPLGLILLNILTPKLLER